MATKAPVIVYTDSYGTVTKGQYDLYRRANVTPAEHDDIVEKFGRENHAEQIAFVKAHVERGAYRAPWPFPFKD